MHNVLPLELNSNSTKYAPTSDNVLLTRFRRLRLYSIVLVVALVIAVLVVLVMIGVHVTQPRSEKQPSGTCASMDCARVSTSVYESMDMSVEPCDDFYRYSCGNWLKKTPIPDSRSRYSRFSELADENKLLLKRSLQEITTGKVKTANSAIQRSADYYQACMDKKKILARGDLPLKTMIAEYGSWPITDNNFNRNTWNFTKTFIDMHRNLSMAPIFNMYVGEDIKNSSSNSIIFDQPRMSLSRPNFLSNSSEYNIKVRAAYKEFTKALVKIMGANDSAAAKMDDLFEFEKQLAEMSLSVNERRNYEKNYRGITIAQFANETNIDLGWLLAVLNELFSGTPVTGDERIISFSTDYIRNAYKIFMGLTIEQQATYMMWSPVKTMADTLLGDYHTVFRDYVEKVYGTTEEDPRWQSCIGSTSSGYGFALGALFVDKTFTKEAKQAAEEMIRGVRTVFIDNLKHLNWMDDETKKAAEEKAAGIIENIGYPEFIRNKTALENYYHGLSSTPDNYFDNILQRRKYYNEKNLLKRGKPVDKTGWGMIPSEVNAYYSATENKIAFPAGILQSPFYDYKAPRALNYGAIGMIVGHEITHGFDDQGRRFDKFGNVKSWWSKSSVTNFKQKAQCLVDQYSQFSLFNRTLNGNQTLGENIADNGGIKASLEAYRSYVAKHGAEQELPGLGLTSEQLYFVGFAQVWCSGYRESAAVSQIDTGFHSLSMFRVRGSVQNSDDFAKAFSCKAGSPMNPTSKCSLW